LLPMAVRRRGSTAGDRQGGLQAANFGVLVGGWP
jgi:hypothetical protein